MSIDYRDAGVDKDAGYREVQLIKNLVKKTHSPQVLSTLGGFSGLFQLDVETMKEPILVSGTDGVGTKLMIAQKLDQHHTIGQDCVAMCVNDILCQGARPLFFLDYIATGKLYPEKMAKIVEGVAEGCQIAGASLIGGETAEMPGMYGIDEYDLAGFCVGVVDREKMITGEYMEEGDVIFGLPSNGIHSNGYSLVRKIIFEIEKKDLDQSYGNLTKTLGEELLTPTKIYVKEMLELMEEVKVLGISHITGGGLYENVPRMVRKGYKALIDVGKIPVPEIFNLLQQWGNIKQEEMYHTFNMGIGLVFVVGREDEKKVQEFFYNRGQSLYPLGKIVKGEGDLELTV
ncbi:MAG: phosphoribosylformylglycinamidine cyclo-ligase [Tissierellia bacterium]|nr:phosphoribosylformylglycinamidine cyclo-ligase [Tissierellia bacterium]